MYASGTQETFEMTQFTDFYKDLLELVKQYEEQDMILRVDGDPDDGLIHIYDQQVSSLTQAREGLDYAAELAYTTAEHHPYWGLLHNCVQTAALVLEKWNDELSDDDLLEIQWMIQEITSVLKRETLARQG